MAQGQHRLVPIALFLALLVLPVASVAGEPVAESGSGSAVLPDLTLTPEQADWVGQQIFRNECAARLSCLVHWNQGEAFPSLGIGHFIWYPAGVEGRFVESFPALIAYLKKQGVRLPDWLNGQAPLDAPWPDRAVFMESRQSPRVEQLREFLYETRGLQVRFILERTRNALDELVRAARDERRAQVGDRLARLVATPGGTYALMDYVNFKGEGLSPSEQYRGEGWGLLQVLLAMEPEPGGSTLDAFREAAGRVLTRRAANADNDIERERWLPGWLKRLETYREPVAP